MIPQQIYEEMDFILCTKTNRDTCTAKSGAKPKQGHQQWPDVAGGKQGNHFARGRNHDFVEILAGNGTVSFARLIDPVYLPMPTGSRDLVMVHEIVRNCQKEFAFRRDDCIF